MKKDFKAKEPGKEIDVTMKPADEELVRGILSAIRKTKAANAVNILRDEKDVAQVISALHAAGYVIIPKGIIDAFNDWIRRIS